jgi:hypothetical protein
VITDSFVLFCMLCILLFIFVVSLSVSMYRIYSNNVCGERHFVLFGNVKQCKRHMPLFRRKRSHRNLVVCINPVCSKCILVQNVYLREYVYAQAKSISFVSKR